MNCLKEKNNLIVVIMVISLVLIFTGCSNNKKAAYERDIFAMDTFITCKIISDDEALANSGLDAVEEEFMKIDQLTNRFEAGSEVSLLNKSAGLKPVKINEDVFSIVQTAIEWSDKSDGAFNILIGSVMDLWGFGTETPAIPNEQDIAVVLNKMDYHKIFLDAEKSTIFLSEKGMVMDLGGVAKGYATDKAIERLKNLGVKNALINAGGNVFAMGVKEDGSPWIVGVQDPNDVEGIKAVLQISDKAVVSSGDYQRYFEVAGIRYHHILDPHTGFPARASRGTTIVMKSATIADILSTTLFVLGPEKGIALAESLVQVDAALVLTDDDRIYGTDSLDEYLLE